MTKPQIWVAAFLLLFIVLFMIGRLTKEEEPMKDFSAMNNSHNDRAGNRCRFNGR